MKNKTTFFVDVLCIFLLVIGLTGCLTSSFVIIVNPFVTGTAALLFTLAFSLVSKLVKSTGKFAASISVMLIVFVITALASFGTIFSQLCYTLNHILSVYSDYFPVADSVGTESVSADNATVLFVFLSALLSFVFSVTIVRARIILPSALLSIILLIPCFVLVNTLPSLISLFIVLVILFTLFVTSILRRNNPSQCGEMTLLVAFITAILMFIIFIFIPIDGYERFEWQDNLLDYVQSITGIESKNGKRKSLINELNVIRDNFAEFKDLSKIGPMQQTKDIVFNVRSTQKGAVYLKGMSYANYEDNVWSVLSDSQAEAFPDGYEPLSFIQTKIDGVSPDILTISCETHQSLIFTPYFLSEIPEDFSACGDVYVKNDLNLSTYELSYYPYNRETMIANEGFYFSMSDTEKSLYNDYVYDTYLDVPENVKSEFLKIAEENNLTGLETEKIPDKVRQFISESAEYSLATPTVPSGKDFAVWFLEESDTGYCAHFATAATLMLRSLGIPARYVTGYYANVDNYDWASVFSGNAHAWTEYYDENIGWIPIDATPASFTASEYINIPDETAETTQAVTEPETTQPTTAQPTAAKESTEPTSSGKVTVSKNNPLSPALVTAILIISVIVCIILAIIARRFIILKCRKKKFYGGRNNEKAVNIYRYILLLSKYSHVVISDEIKEIAERARFSSHSVSNEEVSLIRNFAKTSADEFMDSCSKAKRLYFKYIVIIK